jgi:hypothetical protein
MSAFVGEIKVGEWFEWACKVGICKPDDEVRRFVLDIGTDDVALVYVEKYADKECVEVPWPEIRHVRHVDKSTARVRGARDDGVYVKELTDFGRELHDAKAENTRLDLVVSRLKAELAKIPGTDLDAIMEKITGGKE